MSALLKLSPVTDLPGLVPTLIHNDREYFRAGAVIEPTGACAIVRTPGLEHLDAGCMVEGGGAIVRELPRLVRRLGELGAHSLRVYFAGDVVLNGLEERGFSRTLEPVLVISSDALSPVGNPGALIRGLEPRDDRRKAALFASDGHLPDGKAADPYEYVALEREKIEAGYMRGYLIYCGGEVAATFALSRQAGLVRMKNLYVSPRWRGQRLVETIVAFAQDEARRQGLDAVGVFALAGGAGHRAYLRAGMIEAGVQTEYAAPVGALLGRQEP